MGAGTYGLIGEKLGHSFSPAIHRKLAGYDYRLVEKKPEEKKKPEKTTLSPEERAELAAKAQPGRRVRHNAFGPGIVKNYGNGVVTIRFPEFGEKKFVLLDVVRRGLLRFDEE